MRRALLLVALLLVWVGPLFADVVVPTPDVTSRVIVRQSASGQSAQVGSLQPGQQAELLGSVPNWNKVKLANGRLGFVPKRWTQVIGSGPTPPPSPTAPTFTLDVVDVGTGLGVLVRGADFTLVYDAGSNDDLATGTGNRFLSYLKLVAPTLTVLDGVILSHPHRDHVELLPDLFAAYEVRQVWDSGRINDICGYHAFLTAVRDEPGVQYHNALYDFGTHDYSFSSTCPGLTSATIHLQQSSRITNAPITLGKDATMTILHADGAPYASPNDNSLVVRLDLGTTRVLLVGDAEAGGRNDPAIPPTPSSIEGVLLACCTSDIAANILVVGHHGSKTSSRKAFLDAVSASLFLVSSGPMKYGTVTLPDPEVITELTTRGQVFRTDQDDAACLHNPAKVGPDNDSRAGGCDNIRVTITGTSILPAYFHGSEP